MKTFLFTSLTILGLAVGYVGQPAQAVAQEGGGTIYSGVIYHPQYGQLLYLYNPVNNYVYIPALRVGGYLPVNGGNDGSDGYYGNSGYSPATSSAGGSNYRHFGTVVGDGNGPVGYIPPSGSGAGAIGVTFGPGGPIYSTSD